MSGEQKTAEKQDKEDVVDGFSFSKGYTVGFEAGCKKLEEQLKETRKCVASLNKKLTSVSDQLSKERELRKEAMALLDNILSECSDEELPYGIGDWYVSQIESLLNKAKTF